MSKIKVNEIEKASGSGITVPTGTSFTITDGLAASTISSGTLADARLPTIPVSKGGTGLTSLGTANQELRVNSGASALEFYTPTVATSDFVKIASGSISSGVSSYNVDGHFSSTYKNYELIFDDVYASSTGIDLHMRIIEGGSVISGANYAYGYRYQGVNSSGQNNVGIINKVENLAPT